VFLSYAAEEAALLSHQMIGTEHMFLGLLHDPGSRAAKMLTRRGVDANVVRRGIGKGLVRSPNSAREAEELPGGEPFRSSSLRRAACTRCIRSGNFGYQRWGRFSR